MPTPPNMPTPVGFDEPSVVSESIKFEALPSPVDAQREVSYCGSHDSSEASDSFSVHSSAGDEGRVDAVDSQVINTKNIKAMGLAAGGKLSTYAPFYPLISPFTSH